MITLGYKREGDGVFVPHVDVMRSLNRTFRRAGFEVKYSNGFNRHMALKLTQPLPLGVADCDGYATAVINGEYPAEVLFDRLSECRPPFLVLTSVYITELNPNLAGIVNASSYRVNGKLSAEQVKALNSVNSEYEITLKNGEKKPLGDLVFKIDADENGFGLLSRFGNVNLRVDLLCEQFNMDFGTEFSVTDATRTKQYIFKESFVSAEEYLQSLCREKFISKE